MSRDASQGRDSAAEPESEPPTTDADAGDDLPETAPAPHDALHAARPEPRSLDPARQHGVETIRAAYDPAIWDAVPSTQPGSPSRAPGHPSAGETPVVRWASPPPASAIPEPEATKESYDLPAEPAAAPARADTLHELETTWPASVPRGTSSTRPAPEVAIALSSEQRLMPPPRSTRMWTAETLKIEVELDQGEQSMLREVCRATGLALPDVLRQAIRREHHAHFGPKAPLDRDP